MRQPQLFHLNTILADGLEEIKSLKNLACGLEQYEDGAKFRDIEITFLQLQEELSKALFPVLGNSVTENTQRYYDQLFAYCYFKDWKNLSLHFNYALRNRKEQLNKLFKFSDAQIKQLQAINYKFIKLEEGILEVNQTRLALSNIKSFAFFMDAFEPGTITINCYSNNSMYAFLNDRQQHEAIFYQFKIEVNTLLTELIAFKEDREPEYRKIKNLVMGDLSSKGFTQDICSLFLLFVNSGYLSWSDIMNIDGVGIGLDMSYIELNNI